MDLHKLRKGARIAIASTTAVLMAGVSLASANGDIRAFNRTTGFSSENITEVDIDDDLDIDVENDANADNEVDFDAETGDNSASRNTGDGDVESGSVRGTLDFETTLNAGGRNWSLPEFGDSTVDLSNEETGANSVNEATATVRQRRRIDVSNSANVTNSLSANVDTGGNRANSNTGDGTATSGDISISGSFTTDLNANTGATLEAIGNGSIGSEDVTLSNDTTGANSENVASYERTSTLDVSETNDADVDNDIDLDLNTGDNSASRNTGDGEVQSGDVDFDISVRNILN